MPQLSLATQMDDWTSLAQHKMHRLSPFALSWGYSLVGVCRLLTVVQKVKQQVTLLQNFPWSISELSLGTIFLSEPVTDAE